MILLEQPYSPASVRECDFPLWSLERQAHVGRQCRPRMASKCASLGFCMARRLLFPFEHEPREQTTHIHQCLLFFPKSFLANMFLTVVHNGFCGSVDWDWHSKDKQAGLPGSRKTHLHFQSSLACCKTYSDKPVISSSDNLAANVHCPCKAKCPSVSVCSVHPLTEPGCSTETLKGNFHQ